MNLQSGKNAYKILLESGAVTKDDLDHARKEAETTKSSFCEALVKSNVLKESTLLEIFTRSTGVPPVQLKDIHLDKSIFEKVPVKLAWYYRFFPFKMEQGKLWVAVSEILDIHTLDEIRFGLGLEIELALAPQKEIEEMLKKYYGIGAVTLDKIITQSADTEDMKASTSTTEVEDIEKLADTASVAQLVNQIILEAYRKRASDIHFEPFRGSIRLRYRIDGALHETPVPPEMKKFFVSILSRIKIMANLNVVEKRLPQDGKMRVKTEEETIDLRISCIPTPHGESMVIRILPKERILVLDQLGFDKENLGKFNELLKRPNGVLFVTGPTGSGKTTTLYAALNAIKSMEHKIITIEDPVEYELEGISQIQVAPGIGLDFSRGLRSILRHDPDIMMVGEVRDLETADIAIRAALTGHLILSTLHTNDAPSGITRLLDIGVEPYLVASSIVAFIAQRLVRIICSRCKQEVRDFLPEIRQRIMDDLELDPNVKIQVYAGKGCEGCNGTGFLGRIAIHEILVINDEVRKLIVSRVPAEAIKLAAKEQGMVTLRQDGWKKVLKGVTTPEEIMKTTPADSVLRRSKISGDLSEGEMREVYLAPSETGNEIKKDKLAAGSAPEFREAFMDKRKHKRIKVAIPVVYRVVDYRGEHPEVLRNKEQISQVDLEGQTKNLSGGGLLCISPNKLLTPAQRDKLGTEQSGIKAGDVLGVGSILELKINLPDGGKPINCIAKVLRVDRSVQVVDGQSEFAFQVGVMFLVIHSADRIRIEKFCEVEHENDETV